MRNLKNEIKNIILKSLIITRNAEAHRIYKNTVKVYRI